MGAFTLCVESATRDIHSLLTLHRVHPQVRTDIQRILGGLLRKSYENMTVSFSKELTESSEHVCRALVESVVDDIFKTALPASDMRALDRRCINLEQENAELREIAAEADKRVAAAQEVLCDLKQAHDYMLHSYFREVLVLRCRIDDLQRQVRSRRAFSVSASPPLGGGGGGGGGQPGTTMESQLQHFCFNTNIAAGLAGSDASRRQSLASTTPPLLSAGPRRGSDEPDDSSNSSFPGPPLSATRVGPHTADAGSMPADGDPYAATLMQRLGADGQSRQSPQPSSALPSSARKGRNVRVTSPMERQTRVPSPSGLPPRGVTMQTVTTTTEVVSTPTEQVQHSVDAIFDYEEYVRILNGEQGEWSRRFVGLAGDPEREGGLRARRLSTRLRTLARAEVYLMDNGQWHGGGAGTASGDGGGVGGADAGGPSSRPHGSLRFSSDVASATDRAREQAKATGFRWLLHLALEPIQFKFHTELEKVRRAVRDMQQMHAEQIQVIQRSLLFLQSRNDGLLDFLNTYVAETQQTIALLAQDAQAQTMMELLAIGAQPPPDAEKVSNFFKFGAEPSSAGALRSRPPLALSTAALLSSVEASAEEGLDKSPLTARRKLWRRKPAVVLQEQELAARMEEMTQRLGRSGSRRKQPSSPPRAPTSAADEENFYRADLGLPCWNAHPVTVHAQQVFTELQQVAATMRTARVRQLVAMEEGLASERRRVRFGSQSRAGSYGPEGRRGGARRSPPPAGQHGSRGSSIFYFRSSTADQLHGEENHSLSSQAGHRRLRDVWRTSAVYGASGKTGADLLRELVDLRMRRACDQKRLKAVVAALPLQFRRDAAAAVSERAAAAAATLRTKRPKKSNADGDGAAAAAVALAAEEAASRAAAQALFSSPEEVLRTRALHDLRTRTQHRMDVTSLRIAELQRLLDLHFDEFLEELEDDSVDSEAARQIAAEEVQGLFRVNGELKEAGNLWSSPYLNDAVLDANSRQPRPQPRIVYRPIGLAGAQDADGYATGGAGACLVFEGAVVSAAPFAASADARARMAGAMDGAGGSLAGAAALPEGTLPYVAVMDYCRGVQLGRPLGGRGGPVYLFQDATTGDFYVGDQDGRNVLLGPEAITPSEEGAGVQVGNEGGAGAAAATATTAAATGGVRRPLLPMTRIIFPAPASIASTSAATTAAASDGTATPGLQPVFLVPMGLPLSDDAAVVREGWQASHRHGHTRSDAIYHPTMAPVPLSTSYHHVVPQPALFAADAAVLQAARSAGAGAASLNRYLYAPPRVFRPPDETAAMVQVRSLSLHSRNPSTPATLVGSAATPLADAALANTYPGAVAHAGADKAGAASDSATPGATASLAATPTGPSSLGPLSSPEAQLAAGTAAVSHGWPPSSASAAVPPLALHLALSPSTLGAGPAHLPPSPATAAATAATAAPSPTLPTASAPLPPATSQAASATATAPSLAAALLQAKEQRSTRLAEEAARAAHARSLRQDTLRNRPVQRASHKSEDDVPCGAPHRLVPLGSSTGPGDPLPLLPHPANSARMQRQLRPEKYSLTPPPPFSRWRDMNGAGASAWNLNEGETDST